MKEKKKHGQKRFVRYGLMLLILFAASFLLWAHLNKYAFACQTLERERLAALETTLFHSFQSPSHRYQLLFNTLSFYNRPNLVKIYDMKNCTLAEIQTSTPSRVMSNFGWSLEENHFAFTENNVASATAPDCGFIRVYSGNGTEELFSGCPSENLNYRLCDTSNFLIVHNETEVIRVISAIPDRIFIREGTVIAPRCLENTP